MKVRAKSLVHEHQVDEFDHQNLTPMKEYWVVGFSDASFRVIDDVDEPILYPRALFDVTDASVPEDWIRDDEPDGSFYVDPPECRRPGFYEDLFDGKPEVVDVFRRVAARLRSESY